MNRIFVCSYLVGNLPDTAGVETIRAAMAHHQEWAEMYCWYVVKQGYRPVAPHLFYTRFLDETDPAQRELGISMGLNDLQECSELWVFLRPGEEPSRGMKREIALAYELGLTVRYIDPDFVSAAYAEAHDMGAPANAGIHICE